MASIEEGYCYTSTIFHENSKIW